MNIRKTVCKYISTTVIAISFVIVYSGIVINLNEKQDNYPKGMLQYESSKLLTNYSYHFRTIETLNRMEDKMTKKDFLNILNEYISTPDTSK